MTIPPSHHFKLRPPAADRASTDTIMEPNTPRVIGWVGLGDQGAPMAGAIAEAGFDLHVWGRRPQSVEALGDLPYVLHGSLADLAHASDAVGLCLREDSDVENVLFEGGLLDQLQPGAIVVNHGTGLPGFAADLAMRAAARRVNTLDAPVSGGRPAAESHTLTTIVGGDAPVLDRMRPVFASFSTTIAHMGVAGAGQSGKLINNALLMMNQQNVQMVLRLADQLHLDTQALMDLLLSGTASSFALQALRGAVTPKNAEHLSVLQVIDMQLFDAAMASLGVKTPEISARAVQGARDLLQAAQLASVH